jgi:hypothetical protein
VTTLLQCDVVLQVYNLLSQDATLKAIEGLTISAIRPRGNLAFTTPGPGNQWIIISKDRCGPASWTAGAQILHEIEYVKLEIICKAAQNATTDAKTLCNTIRFKIKELMFSEKFLGTGWLWHKEVTDKYPNPPLVMYANNVLGYEVHTTSGMV